MDSESLICQHVYCRMDGDVCKLCGRDLHETKWEFQHELHREWIASGKAEKQGWWSI